MGGGSGGETSSRTSSTATSADETVRSEILQSALLNLAYVSLCLSNPSEALHSAKRLLNLSGCTSQRKRIASFYASEALTSLDRLAEARQVLSPSLISNDERKTGGDGSVIDADEKASYFLNLSTILALQGNFSKAEKMIEQAIAASATHAGALRLKAYVHLRLGKTEAVLKDVRTSPLLLSSS